LYEESYLQMESYEGGYAMWKDTMKRCIFFLSLIALFDSFTFSSKGISEEHAYKDSKENTSYRFSYVSKIPFLKDVISIHGQLIGFSPEHIHLSKDGREWVSQFVTLLNGSRLRYVGNRYIVVGKDGLYVSRDTVDWEPVVLSGDWVDIAYGDGHFVLVGRDGEIGISKDGAHFEVLTSSKDAHQAMAYNNGSFYVVSEQGHLKSSSDARNWTILENWDTKLSDILIDGDRIFVAGSSGDLYLSFDRGQNWKTLQNATANPKDHARLSLWEDALYMTTPLEIAFVNLNENPLKLNLMPSFKDHNPLHLIGLVRTQTEWLAFDYIYGGLYVLSQGKDWHDLTEGKRGFFKSFLYNREIFVAVGDGISATATNGFDWEYQKSFTAGETQNKVVWNPNKKEFLSVGDKGSIYTSSDGKQWIKQTSKVTSSLHFALWSSTLKSYVIGGDGGVILTSADGISFERVQNLPTVQNLYDITATGSAETKLIVVGDGGVILTSLDGKKWSIPSVPGDRGMNFKSVYTMMKDLKEHLEWFNEVDSQTRDEFNIADIDFIQNWALQRNDPRESYIIAVSSQGSAISKDLGETFEILKDQEGQDIKGDKIFSGLNGFSILQEDKTIHSYNGITWLEDTFYNFGDQGGQDILWLNRNFANLDISKDDSANLGYFYLSKGFRPPSFSYAKAPLYRVVGDTIVIQSGLYENTPPMDLPNMKVILYDKDLNSQTLDYPINQTPLQFKNLPPGNGYRLVLEYGGGIQRPTFGKTVVLTQNTTKLEDRVESYVKSPLGSESEQIRSEILTELNNLLYKDSGPLTLDLSKKILEILSPIYVSDKSLEGIYPVVSRLLQKEKDPSHPFDMNVNRLSHTEAHASLTHPLDPFWEQVIDIQYDERALKRELQRQMPGLDVDSMVHFHALSQDENIQSSRIDFSSTYLKELQRREIHQLDIVTDIVRMKLPIANLKNLEEDLTLKFKRLDSDTLKIHALGDVVAYSIEIDQNGKNITEFTNDLKIEIPHLLKKGTDPNHLTVFYFDPNGKPVNMAGTYDEEKRTISFYTNHLSIYFVNVNRIHFTDNNIQWALPFIDTLSSKEILQGTGQNQFNPEKSLTRAEFITMITKAFRLPQTAYKNHFKDIQGSDWHASFVATGFYHGIIKGDPDGNFRPNDPVTREQMAAILNNLMHHWLKIPGMPLENLLEKLFTDHQSISDYAKIPVVNAYKYGILKGKGKNFDPKTNTSRAEAAVVVYKLLLLEK
jgi:photosystem II stability/assembly factor-like uncharacterized protein